MKIYTLQELEDLTVKWSTDNGIITNGKATTQICKLTSEFGELCGHLHSNKLAKCKDDIGDMAVVLTNISRLIGAENLGVCTPNFTDKREGILVLGDFLGQLADNIIKEEFEKAKTNIGNCIYQLIFLSSSVCKTDFNICWSMAYDEIKDRKGFLTPDGNFIKSTDAAYSDWVKKEPVICKKATVEWYCISDPIKQIRRCLAICEMSNSKVLEIQFTSDVGVHDFSFKFNSEELIGYDEAVIKEKIKTLWNGDIDDSSM